MPSLSTLKLNLFELAKIRGFRDPLTGCFPSSERALSGLLCLYAQREAVRWDMIPLYDVESFERKGYTADLITPHGSFLTEHVLLHRDGSEECIWGGMPADILYVSSDSGSVVMFENKIGGDIGYEPTPESNQLARQLDYLIALRRGLIRSASLLLISTRSMLDLGWYRTEFLGALMHKDRYLTAPGYLVTWEDVFDSISVAGSRPQTAH